ncbi:MAG: double zinc ribbon domain-containing protein [Oscillospiraceae bacterium]|nr:double zinc ribbon domain-containing protein [Oscillospiraceae bacterium]
MYKTLRFILDLIYPSRCPACGDFIGYMDGFCKECESKINMYEKDYKIKYSDLSVSVCFYDENISTAVYTLKDKGGNAPYAFGLGISKLIESYKISKVTDFIIAVPMYKKDKLKRGFNQTELMVKEVSKITGIPYNFDAIFKNRETRHQKTLSREERIVNLRNAFSVKNPEVISGKSIIVIDDLCTTGSTLSEISRILKENGAKNVFCCTYCRTSPR